MSKLKLKSLLLGVCLIAGLSAVPTVQAQSPSGGITVSPAQLNITLTGQADQAATVNLTNNYNVPVSLSAQFKGIDENAGRLIPTDNLDDSLTDNLHLSQTVVTLPPHVSQRLTVQVTNASDLSPGGHYVTLVLTQLNSSNKLSFNAAISLNVFIIKTSGIQEALTASNLQSNGWLFQLPTSVDIDFTNSGNIHTVPRAAIDLRRGPTVLAHGVANIGSLPLLPGYKLTSTAALTKLHTSWLPGRYQMVVTYRADGSDQTQTISSNRWYVPPVDVLIGLIAVYLGYQIYRHRQAFKGLWRRLRRHPKTATAASSSIAAEPSAKRTIIVPVTTPETTSPAAIKKAAKK